MCDDLGVPMTPEKTMGLSSVLCFAGIELDTDKMEAHLTHFYGKSFFVDFQWLSSPHLHLYTDASGSLSYGAVFRQIGFMVRGPHPGPLRILLC